MTRILKVFNCMCCDKPTTRAEQSAADMRHGVERCKGCFQESIVEYAKSRDAVINERIAEQRIERKARAAEFAEKLNVVALKKEPRLSPGQRTEMHGRRNEIEAKREIERINIEHE